MTATGGTGYENGDDGTIVYAGIPTASLLGPSSLVDGSSTSDTTPTLTFTLSDPNGADTVQFHIEIDNNSDFSSPVVAYTSALAAQGATSFTVGQAAGSGSYATGSTGQTLSTGSYYWRVTPTDNNSVVGDIAVANSGAIAFAVAIPPSVSLSTPTDSAVLNTLTSITGTASDSDGTVTDVSVSIQRDSDNLYYTGTSFSNASEQFLATTTSDAYANWSRDTTGIFSDGDYTIRARATDNDTVITYTSTITFTYDSTSPTSTITAPANSSTVSSLSTLSGAITEATSGINTFAIKVTDATDNTYLQSSDTFTATDTFITPTTQTATTWSHDVSSVTFQAGHTYQITTQATDNATNTQSPNPTSTFTFDDASPVMTIVQPVLNAITNILSSITGTGSDDTTITSADITLQEQSSSLYFDGSTFTNVAQTWLSAATSNAFLNWLYDTTTAPFTDGTYIIQSRGTDDGTNTGLSSLISFLFDSTAPTSTITAPVDSSIVSSQTPLSVSGSASDTTSSVSSVTITLQRTSDNYYYDGSSYGASPTNLSTTFADPAWSTTIPSSALSPETSYTITSTATDAATNTQTVLSSVSFSTSALPVDDDDDVDDESSDESDDEDQEEIDDDDQKPTKLTLSITQRGVKLSWKDNTSLDDEYHIRRKTSNSGWETIATIDGDTEDYVDTDTEPGRTYSYRIRALDDGDKGQWSKTVTITLPSETSTRSYSVVSLNDTDTDTDTDTDNNTEDDTPVMGNTRTENTFPPASDSSSSQTMFSRFSDFASSVLAAASLPGVVRTGFLFTIAFFSALSAHPVIHTATVAIPFVTISSLFFQMNIKELFTLFLSFFNLGAQSVRKRRREWGLVFDSTTGQPLSGALITVTSSTGREQSFVSNSSGMYGTLVPEGTYTVRIVKDGYVLPRQNHHHMMRKDHPLFTNEPLTFTTPSLLNVDIALAPVSRRPSVLSSFFRTHQSVITTIFSVFFFLGFFFTIVLALSSPSVYSVVLLLVYVLLLFLRFFGLGTSVQWGRVVSLKNTPVAFAQVKLFDRATGTLVSRTVSDEHGRYYLFADPGRYTLTVESVDRATGQTRARDMSVSLSGHEMRVVTETVRV